MITASLRSAALRTTLGVAAALVVATPAAAATSTPTISAPPSRVGFGTITIHGTATAGATVSLFESAFIFNNLEQALDWQHDNGPLTVRASSTGTYSFTRYLDSGFLFAVRVHGVMSNQVKVSIGARAELGLSSPSAGQVTATVQADPAQPGLPVQLQRQSGSSWITAGTTHTGTNGRVTFTVTGQPGGAHTYRAYIGADGSNAVLPGYSASHAVSVGGGTVVTPAPAPKPTPVTAVVQFTKIVYDAPGADTSANINGEWLRLTNRSSRTINLKNWTVRDAAGNTYKFTDYTLGAGRDVHIRNGKGSNGSPAGYRYWNSSRHVWDNGRDTATLRDSANRVVDTCGWTSNRGSTMC